MDFTGSIWGLLSPGCKMAAACSLHFSAIFIQAQGQTYHFNSAILNRIILMILKIVALFSMAP